MKRCFLSSISAVLIRDFQSVHPKNLLALQYVRNFLPSCITCLSLSIHRSLLRSCDRKFVFRFWCRSRRCHRNKEKGTFKSQLNLCFGGNFPQKIFSQTNYLYINKSLQEICWSSSAVHRWKYSRFNSTQSKNSHNNRAFLFPFGRKKNHSPFSLNFVYGPQSSHRDQW